VFAFSAAVEKAATAAHQESGFLLWQSAHSEFYFTDVLWPALRKVDFLRAIRAY
jgi:undecaprenyl diphosphate synthase